MEVGKEPRGLSDHKILMILQPRKQLAPSFTTVGAGKPRSGVERKGSPGYLSETKDKPPPFPPPN